MLWTGLPCEFKFIREFRSGIISGGHPETLNFDVCVTQPDTPETSLSVWCDVREVIILKKTVKKVLAL